MRLLLQWEKTQEAIREAETLGKIVQAKLEEAAHKASPSTQLKQESDEARRLEVEARNEARWGGVPSLIRPAPPLLLNTDGLYCQCPIVIRLNACFQSLRHYARTNSTWNICWRR